METRLKLSIMTRILRTVPCNNHFTDKKRASNYVGKILRISFEVFFGRFLKFKWRIEISLKQSPYFTVSFLTTSENSPLF